MPLPLSPLDLIRRRPSKITDAAMVQALPTADAVTVNRITQTFLRTGSDLGLQALVEQFGALPKAAQEQLVQQIDKLYGSLRRVLQRDDPETAWHAIELIHQTDKPELADLLSQRLIRSDDPAAPKAAQALLALAKRHSNHRIVSEAIDASARAHSLHRLDALLVAGLHRLPRPVPKLTEAMTSATSPTVQAARRLTAAANKPGIARRLLAIGRLPNMRQAAAEGLEKLSKKNEGLAALNQGHLLALRDTRAPLHRLNAPGALWPSVEQIADSATDTATLRQLSRLAESLPGNQVACIRRLTALRHCKDPVARLTAIRHLLTHPQAKTRAAATSALAAFCLDPHPPIARLVFTSLTRQKHKLMPDVLRQLAASRHAHHRQLAQPVLAEQRFENVCKRWPKLKTADQQTSMMALLESDAHLPERLAKHLTHGSRDDQLTTLSMIAHCGLGELFEEALSCLVSSSDRHLAASAVMALQGVCTPTAESVVAQAATHTDGRVRANAIEIADESTEQKAPEKLAKHCTDDVSRPRANAIAALADQGQGPWLTQLRDMLNDQRDDHRVSAIWVAQNRKIIEAADTLAERAVSDPSPKIRTRAHRALQSLLKQAEGPVEVVHNTQKTSISLQAVGS